MVNNFRTAFETQAQFAEPRVHMQCMLPSRVKVRSAKIQVGKSLEKVNEDKVKRRLKTRALRNMRT